MSFIIRIVIALLFFGLLRVVVEGVSDKTWIMLICFFGGVLWSEVETRRIELRNKH